MGSLALLALLTAGPLLANPGTHSVCLRDGEALLGTFNRPVHQASIVDDIVDVIDDIIDDLTGGGSGDGRGGNP